MLLAAALAGCGDQIDTGRVEREIAEEIERQTRVDVDSVDCPEDIETRKGDTFECTADGEDGGRAPVVVRQLDDEGNVTFSARGLEALTR